MRTQLRLRLPEHPRWASGAAHPHHSSLHEVRACPRCMAAFWAHQERLRRLGDGRGQG